MREIKVIHDAKWRVEDIDCDDDRGCAVAIFSGPFAEQRARRYADRLRTNAD